MRRVEGAEKVTGRLAFTEDMPLPGLVHAKLLTSYVARGAIRAIRFDVALTMPGVIAVLTANDLGLDDKKPDDPEQPLARSRVFHVGQPVAAVVADTPEAAADAAGAVEIEYDLQPAVIGQANAERPDAPVVLPNAAHGDADASIHGAAGSSTNVTTDSGNVISRADLRRGNTEDGFATAATVAEGVFTMASVHHGFLEPRVVTAAVERDGLVWVWSPTQGPAVVQEAVAESLGLAASQVRVVAMPVGGGFGGKILQLEPLVAHIARAVGRPVRLQLTRTEEFATGRGSPSSQVEIAVGASASGELSALRAKIWYDNGAAFGWHSAVTADLIASTYRVPNLHVLGFEVATNKLPTTTYRAPGAPQAYFALESAIDELARSQSTDPIQFRLRNASSRGDLRGDGSPWPEIGMIACLEAASRHPVYTDPKVLGEGIGVAVGGWIGGFGPAAALCRVDRDGALTLQLGSVDISGTDTGFALLAGELFGIGPERVRIRRTDSSLAPVSPVAGGSSITYSLAPAVAQAVLEVRRQVLEVASAELEAAVSDMELVDGRVQVRGVPSRSLPVDQMAKLAEVAGGPGPIHAIGRASVVAAAPMFCVHVARVRVDIETGSIQVARYAAIHDVGRVINRAEVIGQVHGGVLQGLGRALGEEIVYDDAGQLRTSSFIDYALPTVDQAPPIDVQLVSIPSELGTMGIRGVGEPPAVPVPAAVANAIFDACGIRLRSVPFALEAIALVKNP